MQKQETFENELDCAELMFKWRMNRLTAVGLPSPIHMLALQLVSQSAWDYKCEISSSK